MYCPPGSGLPKVALPGEYTVGPTSLTRNGTLPCPSGSYCINGTMFPCPAGRFGCADRLGSSDCNGPCTAGFFCPEGSRSSQAFACGGNASNPLAATFYCPAGSWEPLPVGVGNYSYGSSVEAPHRRTAQSICPVGSFCIAGRASLCPSGRFGGATGLMDPLCSGPCAPTFTCPPGSSSSQELLCPAGSYCPGGPMVPCAAGLYYNVTGAASASACQPCPASTYSPVPGTARCLPCDDGDGSDPSAMECWPTSLSAVASNPPPLVAGISSGDFVTLVFSSRTNTPVITPDVVAFSPSIGPTSAAWSLDGTTLVLRVLDPSRVNATAVDVATRRLRVTVTGVRSASGLSQPSAPVTLVVGGTWGAPAPPAILRAVALDLGRSPGLGSGDGVVFLFDQDVVAPPLTDTPAMTSVLRFTPPPPAGTLLSGAWQNSSALQVVFNFDGVAPGLWNPSM